MSERLQNLITVRLHTEGKINSQETQQSTIIWVFILFAYSVCHNVKSIIGKQRF